MLSNDATHYGWLTRYLHWGIALAMVVVVASGWYAIDIGYMSPIYARLLDAHQLVGLCILAFGILMMLWHIGSRPPSHLASLSAFERWAARVVHTLLYLSLLLIPVTGYVATTQEGPQNIFGLTLPALIVDRESIALAMHYYLGYGIVALMAMHAGAALKHHFINRDSTLRRMLFGSD